MNSKRPGISELIAARVNTARRGPGSSAPFLRLARSDDDSKAPPVGPDLLPERATLQIRTLMNRLHTVVRKAMASAVGVNEVQVIQACIDKTVDAVANLLHTHRPAGSSIYRGLDLAGFFDIRRGGRWDLIKNHLSVVTKVVSNSVIAVASIPAAAAHDEIARENTAANQITQDDLDFASQISKLTQVDILAHTSNQFRRRYQPRNSPILEIETGE